MGGPRSSTPTEPAFSITEIASTIMADFVEQTRKDPKPTYSIAPSQEIPKGEISIYTAIPTNVMDTIDDSTRFIYTLYPCIHNSANLKITKAEVVEIIDGDTIKVNINDEIIPVRYIGIDTPDCNNKQENKCIDALEAKRRQSRSGCCYREH